MKLNKMVFDDKKIEAAAFCFGQDFLFYYSSEDMVVVGNKYDK